MAPLSLQAAAESVWEAVSPLLPGFTVEVVPEIDSTNTELMRRARAGRCEPVLLVAERQVQGRGRLGRQWDSVAAQQGAALTFSLGLELTPADWSGLSLAVGLGVAEALHPEIRIKWPNDLLWQGRKLAGILIETATVGTQRYAVVGVGINVEPRSGDGLRTAPAWLQELRADWSAAEALKMVVPLLVRRLQTCCAEGFGPLRAPYHARDALYGQEVLCSDGVTGQARGVDAQGALLVMTPQGLQKINSSEVSVRAQTPMA
ncbi:biotin--[acetyl-CoA-carboxylase] ligase [Curvibacter sp. APW13]|uniref:biotin--[acetyl-CoA-carboxylase] ligase n=1 Tax=Curvibacter sp. APW13 TaxID=3077236 RepID=UPI0028E011FC|nr:biotin--[acetyl-CoA-carboxylase] ligase [Curvibacter sp. APW13]MDT8990157.1 biotin--[acetyl-CoA-carboxylase] ligase [Curvibacter sp. APW13]